MTVCIMKKKIYKKRKRGPVQAKKVTYDGIKFASGLERYMYMALKKAKIKAKYEGETYEVVSGFDFINPSYERTANGKGEFNSVRVFLNLANFVLFFSIESFSPSMLL